jgi:hypothetical protein
LEAHFKKWLEFSIEAQNIRLRLALDGMNPFGNLSFGHFTWPIILLNYNLPLWLVTKCYFLMLVLIIPSKELITTTNVDVYLEPFIKEL